MLDTSGVAWTRKNTWFQRGTTMLDTSGVAWTRKNTWFQPTRGGYLRCGRLGRGRAQDHREAAGGQHARPTNPERNIEMRNMEMFHDTELTDGQLQCSK